MLMPLITRNRDDEAGARVILDQHPVQLVFKHSPLCVMSAMAREQVERFARTAPSIPIVIIDVIRQRQLSAGIAQCSRVRHESPQVLLVVDGTVLWHVSHGAITVQSLSRAMEGVRVKRSHEPDAS